MKTVREGELLDGARRFDPQFLAQIYDLYSPRLYAYSLRLLGDPNLAEDCVAETFSRFLQALRGGRGPDEHLQAYLYRIAHNWITDQYRRNPPPALALDEKTALPNEQQPEPLAAQQIEKAQVRAALHRLTPEQRQVIVLKFLEGWENPEIAEALQKPVGAIKALQHRALASLKRMLAPTGTSEIEQDSYEPIG